jgi:hypothetical protein
VAGPRDDLASRSQPHSYGRGDLRDGAHLRLCHSRSHAVDLFHLLQHRALHFFHDPFELLLALAQEGVEKGGRAHVVPLLPVLEVHVHRLPEHVVEDLEDLLADERVFVR